VLLLLLLVLLGTVARIIGGAAATGRPATSSPTPSAAIPADGARRVVKALAAVERAFNAGDARLLCRRGRLVDPAVLRNIAVGSGGCESELESLMADEPPLRLAVRRLSVQRDLATATVTTARGTTVPVDLVRQGFRWLLSFSDGDDPMPKLAGAET
jgi:hypothetical protein